MSGVRRVRAELVTIGSELLLGEIVDTNAAFIARELRELGAEVTRKTSVGDAVDAIAEAVRAAAERADVVITTGGIGPTVDDPTRQAIASAAGVGIEFRPALWEQVQEIYRRYGREPTPNNRAQAEVPVGSTAIPNAVGTAPAFHVDIRGAVVIALPGVPREMTYLYETAVVPLLRGRFPGLGHTVVRLLHCVGAGESQIDAAIGDLELLANPSVGLAAHSGMVDVRLTAHGATVAEAAAILAPVEADARRRLGGWVFGADDETLEGVIGAALAARGEALVAVEAGLGGALVARLGGMGDAFAGALVLPHALERKGLEAALDEAVDSLRPAEAQCGEGEQVASGRRHRAVDQYGELHVERAVYGATLLALGVSLVLGRAGEADDAAVSRIEMVLRHAGGVEHRAIAFGGHPDLAARRAVFGALDLLRKRA